MCCAAVSLASCHLWHATDPTPSKTDLRNRWLGRLHVGVNCHSQLTSATLSSLDSKVSVQVPIELTACPCKPLCWLHLPLQASSLAAITNTQSKLSFCR